MVMWPWGHQIQVVGQIIFLGERSRFDGKEFQGLPNVLVLFCMLSQI